jgi:hypothetical protein
MYRALASGALVEVGEDGTAEFLTCSWLIEVATGHPEPDFPSDLYDVVECGAKVFTLDGAADLDHTTCEFGHERHAMGTSEWYRQEWEAEMRERAAF